MEEWLLNILRKSNVPDPSVKPPTGEKSRWRGKSKWSLLSRGKKFTSVLHEHVLTKRDDIVEKSCEQIYVVKAEIVCFIDPTKTWDTWTAPLKAARSTISQIKNQMTQLLLANDRADDLFGKGCAKKGAEMDKFLYHRIAVLQEELSAKALEKVEELKDKEKLLKKKDDEASLKALKAVQKELINANARANLKLCGGLTSVLSRSTVQTYRDWRSKSFKKSVPSMRPQQPIPLRAGSNSPEWDIAESNEGHKISFLVCSNFGRQHASVKITGGNNHATINDYLAGKATRRDAKLFYDERRKRWVISMTFGRPRKEVVEGDSVAAIRIGVNNFIFVLDDAGRLRDLETFHKSIHEMKSHDSFRQRIIPRKLEFKQIKSDARKDRNFQGCGARGHGVHRFCRTYDRYKDAEARFVKTWMGQIAAAAVRYCMEHGINKVYIAQMDTAVPDHVLENGMPEQVAWLIKRFPFCALRDAIIHALERAGIEVVITEDGRDCDTCPKCGHIDAQNHNPRTVKFWCVKCDTRLAADYVASWNYLKKNGVDCSKIEKRVKHMQTAYKEMDEKAVRIKEEEDKFVKAHQPHMEN